MIAFTCVSMMILAAESWQAAAALIGIPFGKHKVQLRITGGKKSWEGSAAMFAVAFLTGFLILLFARHTAFLAALPAALIGAFVGTGVELVTPSEYDTVTVPVAVLAVLLLLTRLL